MFTVRRPSVNDLLETPPKVHPQETMTISVTTNRSCVLLRALTVEIRDVPIPPVGDDDVLVKVEATGICGSDVRARPSTHLHVRLP